jgi:HAD superfamily hydrolase (TIGR01484 family)
MLPLSDLDVRARVLLFDVDDTVTSDGVLQACSLDAMFRAKAAGIRLVAVTGRPLGWAEVFAWTWPIDMAIGENGAGWMWREGRAFETHFDAPHGERALHQTRLREVLEEVSEVLPQLPRAGDSALRRCDVAWDIGETRHATQEERETLRAIIARHGLIASYSSVHAHAIPGDWNKARGAERALLQRFGMSAEEAKTTCVFVGDSGNDAAAFGYFDHSVGVSNVHESLATLTSKPKYVTQHARGEGFAELVSHLIDCRERHG